MPTGGAGALLFWVGICLFMGASTAYFYAKALSTEKQLREMRGQDQLLFRENQKLRSEVDKLQTELVENGSLLRNREQVLQQAAESLQAIKKEKETLVSTPPPPTPTQLLAVFMAKAEAARKNHPLLNDCALLEEGGVPFLRINNTLLFAPGDPNVIPKGVELLKEVGLFLKEIAPNRVLELRSHTDNVPPAANLLALFPTNWEVSARRATTVLRVLAGEGGLSAQSLRPIGMGDSHPVAPNDTKENKALNRRLEIVITPTEELTDSKPNK